MSRLASAVAAELNALRTAHHTQSYGSLESLFSKVVISHVIIIGRRGRRGAVVGVRLVCLILQPDKNPERTPSTGNEMHAARSD